MAIIWIHGRCLVRILPIASSGGIALDGIIGVIGALPLRIGIGIARGIPAIIGIGRIAQSGGVPGIATLLSTLRISGILSVRVPLIAILRIGCAIEAVRVIGLLTLERIGVIGVAGYDALNEGLIADCRLTQGLEQSS